MSVLVMRDGPIAYEIRQARLAGQEFRRKYAFEPNGTDVASSELPHAHETAVNVGFRKEDIGHYALLNEVDHGLTGSLLRQLLDRGRYPGAADIQAGHLLENPPTQPVWITSGLVVMGLCRQLGIMNQFEHFYPKHFEIRDLPIDIPN